MHCVFTSSKKMFEKIENHPIVSLINNENHLISQMKFRLNIKKNNVLLHEKLAAMKIRTAKFGYNLYFS